MKNPLKKRIPKELKQEFGKYFIIFAFLVMLISLISGFLVAGNSMMKAYDDGYEKYQVENGHLSFDKEPDAELIETIEKEADVTLYKLHYVNLTDDNEKKYRIYAIRDMVNLQYLMEGRLPSEENEIAIDRLFAENNSLEIGDTVQFDNKEVVISGTVSLTDYSCLYEKNTDMMFNATNFSVAVMTMNGFESLGDAGKSYTYAWKYNTEVSRTDDKKNKEMGDELLDNLKNIMIEYNEKLVMDAGSPEEIEEKIISIDDFLPQYQNQAIVFAREDIGSDTAFMLWFGYLVVLLIAFIFAVTISNTIVAEAGTIGTLRATGYTRGELIRHYMTLPVLVTLIAAIIGNILGYTVLKDVFADLYYHSYSLTGYTTIWNMQAFINTTVVPVILMLVINFIVLAGKLRLSPIRFLRHDLSKKGRKKAFRLNTKIPFLHRFRLRVIFQNISNYVTLFFGIFLGGVLAIFGFMFVPLLEDYKELALEQRVCDYQYVLTNTNVETKNPQAEKYSMTSLKTQFDDYVEDEVSVYGLVENSQYIQEALPEDGVMVTTAFREKFGLEIGDVIELKDNYTDTVYTFKISKYYNCDTGFYIYTSQEEYNRIFEKKDGYFTGFFSNERLDDVDDESIATVVQVSDITKTSDQLLDSIGGFMGVVKIFAVIMFILLMYLLSKQIIEKNSQSIAMTKILGFKDSEIGGIYVVTTSIIVLASLLITCPLTNCFLHYAFRDYIYKMVSGYIPYIISDSCYIKMVLLGIICYVFTVIFQMHRIKKIPKADALKNVE